ncbi:MAG: hypothetical protein ACI3W5_14380 [Faecousia sp.]
MKNSYIISAQFVNNNAKFDAAAKAAVQSAIKNYNTKSLIARNPKQIVDYSFSRDNMTLKLTLESEADLPMPTKALRLLSSYLVEETCLDKYLSGKQLFKMTTTTASDVSSEGVADEADDLRRLERYIKLLRKTDTATIAGLKKIDEIIDKLL